MREQLKNLNFKFEGSCNCHGETSYTFSYPNSQHRIEVSNGRVWVKGFNGVRWSTIDFGNSTRFQEFLTKYFNL